jgi:hypothetical protein
MKSRNREIMNNLMGKSRDAIEPYAVFEGCGPFGATEIRLLKVYQKPALENSNAYARWCVAVKTEEACEAFDVGDCYVSEAVRGLTLAIASDPFIEQYGDCLNDLQNKAGFEVADKRVMSKT